jgi:DNA-binding response OmpR family regulator
MNLKATKGEKLLDLSHREFEIMKYFIANRGEVISRVELLDRVWGYDGDIKPMTRTVDTHIAKLRKKIEDSTENPRWIITAHRIGYRFMG